MRKLFLTALPLFLVANVHARVLDKATFTQVVNQVRVVSAADKKITPAKLQAQFNTPDLIQTGPRSLAELTAPDNTITRVGSNTIFSYARRGRTVNLQRGSVLFHSPKGKGGGVIRTKAASASVLGTTLIVSATADGGFKCVVLEGKAQLQMPNGNYRIARPGQVVFVMSGGDSFGPTVDVNLEKLVEGSNLVQEFEQPLPSLPKVNQAVERQKQDIESGRLIEQDESPQNIAPIAGPPEPDETPVVAPATVTQTIEALADRLTVALGSDLTISGTPFDSRHVFLEPVVSTVSGLSKSSFKGVLAHNILMSPPSATDSHVQLDFAPYLSGSTFSILADAVLRINAPHLNLYNSDTATGSDPDFQLHLIGRTGVEVASGTAIFAERVGHLTLASGAAMNLDSVSIRNSSRGVTLNAQNGLTLSGTSVSAAGGHNVFLKSAAGDLLVQNSTLSGQLVQLVAANDLTVNGGTFTADQLQLRAAEDLSVTSLMMSGVSSTVMEARTLILRDINFSGNVTLRSQVGDLAANPNSGAVPVIGHVNFIQNVNYNGQPAQFFRGSTIMIEALP